MESSPYMTSPRKTKLPPPRHPLENRNSAPDIGKNHAFKKMEPILVSAISRNIYLLN